MVSILGGFVARYRYIKHDYRDSLFGKTGEVVDKRPFKTKSDDPYQDSDGGSGWLWRIDGKFGSTYLINADDVEEIK